MRRRHWFSILNYLTFPALPRKERKIYIQRSSFSTTVRSQTNVTHVVSVSKVSSKIQSSSKLISATSTPFSQQQRTSATFPQRRTNQQAQNCQISAPSAASLHNWQLPLHLFQLSQAQRLPQPQQIPTVPSFFNPQSNTANNPAGSLWHLGMSPNRYEVVLLEPMVKKCYGCGSAFSERFRSSPFNVILKHVDRRIVTGNNDTGQFQYCSDYSNTYYHLSVNHVKKKNPLFTGLIVYIAR